MSYEFNDKDNTLSILDNNKKICALLKYVGDITFQRNHDDVEPSNKTIKGKKGIYALAVNEKGLKVLKYISHAGISGKQTNSIYTMLAHIRTPIHKAINKYMAEQNISGMLKIDVFVFEDKNGIDNDLAGILFDQSGLIAKKTSWNNSRPHKISKLVQTSSTPTSKNKGNNPNPKTDINLPKNLIFFGAPGTGKSHLLNELADKEKNKGAKVERVTFYPDYSYYQFVGSYKPNMKDGKIEYSFIEGPFTRILASALQDNTKTHILIIEEINRANAAAVFGDTFQLLDRGEDDRSEYYITPSNELRERLKELGVPNNELIELRIPNNMYIWATMNSADQGVYALDTAFKRRWEFKYIGINEKEEQIKKYYITFNSDSEYSWNSIRKSINKFLSENAINEDKQLGPFFIDCSRIPHYEENNKIYLDPDEFSKVFKSKVLMYLFEDAARSKRSALFSPELTTYSEICKEYDADDIGVDGIFSFDITDF